MVFYKFFCFLPRIAIYKDIVRESILKLRSKFTITLLLTSLVSAALVGGTAYWLLMRDFRQTILDQAFENFQTDVVGYLSAYGSWQEGRQVEPFPLYVQRRGRHSQRPGAMPPESGLPGMNRSGRPPFRFLLFDTDGLVLNPTLEYAPGQSVSDRLRRQARPIVVNDRLTVYALPLGEPVLSPQDMTYLAAMRRALFFGFIVAGSLAVLLGLLLGRRMGSTLEELISAVRNMHTKGATPQQVPVRTRDEIGILAAAFNAMSAELAEAHDELKELSIRDPLTQLYNRRHFAEQAAIQYEQARRYNHHLSIMVGDLDHFKQINDTFSHSVGDKVLRRVGHLLCQYTRKSDIIARHGGEEFVILFTETPLEQAARHCEELRRHIESEPWQDIHPELRVTMSMGISSAMGEAAEIETLLHEADLRLYAAKRGGRNRVVSEDPDSKKAEKASGA